MKNIFKATLALTLVVVLTSGCQQKTSSTKKKSTSSSDGLTGGDNNTDTGSGTGTLPGCNGLYRDGASRCYYKNIPKITLNGAGNPNQTGASVEIIGPVLWTSLGIPGYDQNSFVTDATFHLRIKPESPYQNEKTVGNRFCSNDLSQFSRMKVYFMLRNSVTSVTTPFSVTANLNQYSQKIIVEDVSRVPTGAKDKILEVVGVMTDHRCKRANPPAGCSAGTYWGDIPLNTTDPKNPTGCASFTIEYATDTTYDLP